MCVYTCARALCVFVSLCWSVRWSAVLEFGQKVNNYSAYSVIMVPVSPATREEGAPSRLSSSVMKYRHWGALYTWIFINTGLTVMSPEQVGWDIHIRVRSIRQEAVGETVKTSKFTLQEHSPTASWGCTPTRTYIHICLKNNNKKQWLNVYSLLYAAWKFACGTCGKLASWKLHKNSLNCLFQWHFYTLIWEENTTITYLFFTENITSLFIILKNCPLSIF